MLPRLQTTYETNTNVFYACIHRPEEPIFAIMTLVYLTRV